MKILVIQFKALGDTVLLVPALKALRQKFPDCALHVLVKEEAAPILRHLPWLTRVWTMPRVRGKARFRESWPIVRALRRERFDRSVDFGGNDRGAILSWLCRARRRLGPVHQGGFLWRSFCYTERATIPDAPRHETLRLLSLLSNWVRRTAASRERYKSQRIRLWMCRRKPCFLRPAFSATSARAVRKSSGRCGTGWRFIHWPFVPGIRWFFRPARAIESNTWLSNSSNGSPRRSFSTVGA